VNNGVFRVKALPSSFVANEMKFEQDRGKGEAKLFVGPIKEEKKVDDFFEFDKEVRYKFSKSNMLEYLQQMKIEYGYQSLGKYKNVNISSWDEKYNEISLLSAEAFECSLKKYTDISRYYVRANEDIFKNIFRKIALPKITNIIFRKVTEASGIVTITINLEINFDFKAAMKVEIKDRINYGTGIISLYPRNRIFFGAPGTGKSYELNKQKEILLDIDSNNYERVTFHPDYSYANFVGTYKPVPSRDVTGNEVITYEYVPGPFIRTLIKALRNSKTDEITPFLLIIEEINRANVAAVFGDIFQLLDRGDDEISEYPIATSRDMRTYLAKEENLGGSPEEYAEIKIPDNMFIWGTMNSADQGVYPMDTAFKRRWNFVYLGIDDNQDGIANKNVVLGIGDYKRIIEWNKLRKAINDELLKYKVNEDKLLGPYFVSKKNLITNKNGMIDREKFIEVFKSKVIMYLFDDAAKQKSPTLFGGCGEKSKNQYSKICKEFERKGVFIFCTDISNQFVESVSVSEIEGNE